MTTANDTYIGRRSGRLVVTAYGGQAQGDRGARLWLCDCQCGGKTTLPTVALRRTRSCGCLQREGASRRAILRNRKHGMHGTPEYGAWKSMVDRCTNSAHPAYARYGGRGITVCERWRGSFVEFFADLGPRPSAAHTLERIDNNCGYQPGNCKWATRREQARNRRSNRVLEHEGQRLILAEWAERTGLSRDRIVRRLRAGWTVADALTIPSREGKSRGHP